MCSCDRFKLDAELLQFERQLPAFFMGYGDGTIAICAHVSKIMSGFLEAFVRTNELYAVLDASQLVLPRQYYFHPGK